MSIMVYVINVSKDTLTSKKTVYVLDVDKVVNLMLQLKFANVKKLKHSFGITSHVFHVLIPNILISKI